MERTGPDSFRGPLGADPHAEAHACRDADSRAFRRTVAGAFRPPETEIPDDPAPLEPAPDAPADIPEAPVPQGDLPQTGSVRQSDARGLGAVALSMSVALFAGGILLRRKEKNGG